MSRFIDRAWVLMVGAFLAAIPALIMAGEVVMAIHKNYEPRLWDLFFWLTFIVVWIPVTAFVGTAKDGARAVARTHPFLGLSVLGFTVGLAYQTETADDYGYKEMGRGMVFVQAIFTIPIGLFLIWWSTRMHRKLDEKEQRASRRNAQMLRSRRALSDDSLPNL